jgi:hypothetical protein
MKPKLDEGAPVNEQIDPLPRGQLALLVLLGDLLRPPAELDLLPAPMQVVDERLETTLLTVLGGRRKRRSLSWTVLPGSLPSSSALAT